MNLGMMWSLNPKDTLEQAVADAATYYGVKYGRKPNLCWVNPKMLTDDQLTEAEQGCLVVSKLKVRYSRAVLDRHLWMGME